MDGFTDAPAPGPDPEAPKPEVTPPSDGKMRFPLSKPIKVRGDAHNPTREISVVPVRKPTAGDILAAGNPVIFDPGSNPPRITHDSQKMGEMLFRLTGLIPAELERMEPDDLVSLFWFITPFFIPRPGSV